MSTRPLIRFAVALLTLSAAVSCSDSTAPETRAEGDLHFVRFASDAPQILDTTITFWAKKGQNAEVRMRYVGGEDFVRFEVPGEALDRRPDGSVIALGDSVKITVTVADFSQMIFAFQPSGLRFNSQHPARLKILFNHGDEDLDHDGVVDATDIALKATLGIWRQERSGDPWVHISNIIKLELDEAEAEIFGFTTYALAY